MVRAKSYENVSTLLKLCRENCGLFFPDTVYIIIKAQRLSNDTNTDDLERRNTMLVIMLECFIGQSAVIAQIADTVDTRYDFC